MSVIVTVGAVGAVMVNTGVLVGMATAVATAMGMKSIHTTTAAEDQQEGREQGFKMQMGANASTDTIEISSNASNALKKVVAERCEMTFADAEVSLTVKRDIRGTLTVRAHSETVSKQELSRRAEALLGGIQQQVAYREAVALLKSKGFQIEQEERLADGTARVKVVKIG